MTIRVLAFTCAALIAGAGNLHAQPADQTPAGSGLPVSILSRLDMTLASLELADGDEPAERTEHSQTFDWAAQGRACEGCPPRSVGRAVFQSTMINVFYGLANLLRGHDTAKVTPEAWWTNMKQGWVWDLNDFPVNQIGHPYQGNNYFTAGRANGLSFYESSAVAAFGSATWEYFGETNSASLNDFINTTLGGIALGEMFHRTAWLVRDTRATGRGRMWREIAATAFDPVGGYNNFTRGDGGRVYDKPADMVPSGLGAVASLGALWRGQENGSVSGAEGQAFLEVDLLYGDTRSGSTRTPYDAFGVRLRFGGGSSFSEARVRGRLLGEPLSSEKLHFSVIQTYDYQNNDAYATGSQSFDAALGFTQPLSERFGLWVLGWGGLTILGAVDSLPPGVDDVPDPEEGGDDSHSANAGPRFYDYGPGGNFGVTTQLTHDKRIIAGFFYEGRHIYSLDGVRANHFLQRARLDLMLPVRGAFGFGTSMEYFNRHTFYQDATNSERDVPLPAGQGIPHMDTLMRSLFALVVVLALAPAEAAAQAASTPPPLPSRLWITVGAASATLRGDCQTCETDYPYRHDGSVLGNAGYRVNHRMDVGLEVFWVPMGTAQGTIRTTHFDAVAQFRPWASQGFFMKGGAGMAYVRNWVDTISTDSINSKALSVVIGAGWEFKPLQRFGFQVFGSQHVAAMGDLVTADGDIPDVVGNFWSVGAAIVIR